MGIARVTAKSFRQAGRRELCDQCRSSLIPSEKRVARRAPCGKHSDADRKSHDLDGEGTAPKVPREARVRPSLSPRAWVSSSGVLYLQRFSV